MPRATDDDLRRVRGMFQCVCSTEPDADFPPGTCPPCLAQEVLLARRMVRPAIELATYGPDHTDGGGRSARLRLTEAVETYGRDSLPDRDIPAAEQIKLYLHCKLCLKEMPKGQSPRSYQRVQAGFSPLGLQVWCLRHDANIAHIDFQGMQHPANTDRERTADDYRQDAEWKGD